MPVTECTCSALRRAARRVSQMYDHALAPESLRTSQYSVLSTLSRWTGEAPTVLALADALTLDRTTLGHNLLPLERSGLVAIDADPVDKRVRRIRLTDAGRAKHRACHALWRDVQKRFDDGFGAVRSAALRDELAVVAQGIDLGRSPAREGSSDAV